MSKEIRKQINDLYAELEEIVIPGNFILDPKIAIVSNKIEALQKQCSHHFVKGQCEFCDLEEV
jgi:deoxyribose-phosphate aldolase